MLVPASLLPTRLNGSSPLNILTIDLENWYPSEYYTPPHPDDAPTLRHLHDLLQLLRANHARATFFILGELAERNPQVLHEIISHEHEVAYHSYHHNPLPETTPEAFKQGLERFKQLTRDEISQQLIGFRAPLFRPTPWLLPTLQQTGFKYDSSIFPAWTPLYGYPTAPTQPYHPDPEQPSRPGNSSLWELPLHVLQLGPLRFPLAGGFYARLFPQTLLDHSLRNSATHTVYLHPRELDPQLPRVPLNPIHTLLIYYQLPQARKAFQRLLQSHSFQSAQSLLRQLQ